MRAVILEKFNSPFYLDDLDKPTIGPRQVLVKIQSVGINPLDIKIRAGQAAHAKAVLPLVPGVEMSGIIESIGKDVHSFSEGDRVFGLVGGVAGKQGTLAEYISVDEELIAKMPAELTFREAAAIPLNIITAWEALVDRANVAIGNNVLIHGGNGGVGNLAIQLARYFGAVVFATGSREQLEVIRQTGATPIDYVAESVFDYVSSYTSGDGFDIVLDTVGGIVLDHSFSSVRQYTGHVVSVLGWGTHNLAPLSFRGATYSGVFVLYPMISGKAKQHHGFILQQAAQIFQEGMLYPRIDPTHYSLSQVELAYKAVHDRSAIGKVVIEF